MNDEVERLRFRCPKCDHLVVTVPLGYRVEEPLICPGCGEELEVPETSSELPEAK